MVKQWRNEDIIAPADAQRWEDGVDQSLKGNVQNAGDLKKHAEDKNNPHAVTAAQVGLGNVLNVEQYSKLQTDSLINGVKGSIYLGQYTKMAADLIHTYPTGTSTTFVRSNEGWPSFGTVVTMKGVSAGGGSLQIYTPYNTETGDYGGKSIKYRTVLYDANSPGALPWSEWKDLATTDGNIATATKLQTARTIAGVDFDGSKDIDIPAGNVGAYTKAEADTKVAVAKREVIDGNVASATKLQTARTISLTGGVTGSTSFDGSGNASISATVAGNAPSATRLTTPRKIAGVDFDGTRDIAIPAGNVGAYTKSETDDKFDDISVPTRNYLMNSEAPLMAGYMGATAIYTPNQTVEEWRATNAVRHEVSGGTNTIFGTLSAGRTVTPSTRYIHSIFIKNIGTTNVRVNNNLGTVIIVTPGESKRIVFPPGGSAVGSASMQFVFTRDRVEDICDFILWRAMIGEGSVVGDWVPNPDELVFKNDVDMSIVARNLLVNSSLYNNTNGWDISQFVSVESTGEYTRFTKGITATRATIGQFPPIERIIPSTNYDLSIQIYVEETSNRQDQTSTVFLRTNNGTMLDSPIGVIDMSKVGEWQTIKATGMTRPAPYAVEPRFVIAITADTSCVLRVREGFLGWPDKWQPAPEDKAGKSDLEIVKQKVQNLEENTIRLTNQFPDPDFQKREPSPFNEGNFAMTYDSNGVVLNNTTATKGRVYWATPPLNLAIGRSYNVEMLVNTDHASVRKPIEVGTVTGENIKFELQNTSPVWIQGTIKLTTFAAFSIWLEPSTVLRIRELHIYEANTDITTSRIERLEKDNSLPPIEPRFELGFMNYSSASGVWYCHAERRGDIVALSGAIANSVSISTTGFDKILMARLPVGYRPKKTVNRVMAGSGTAIFNMEIDPTGEIYMARYRGATTSFTYAPIEFVGAWLNVGTTYLGEDM